MARKIYLGHGRWSLPRTASTAPKPRMKKIVYKPDQPPKKKPVKRRKKATVQAVKRPLKALPKKKRGWFW